MAELDDCPPLPRKSHIPQGFKVAREPILPWSAAGYPLHIDDCLFPNPLFDVDALENASNFS